MTLTYRDAMREAIRDAMRRDERVFLMGEDVGPYGGSFGVSRGLLDEFGPDRIRDTPLSESAFVGAGIDRDRTVRFEDDVGIDGRGILRGRGRHAPQVAHHDAGGRAAAADDRQAIGLDMLERRVHFLAVLGHRQPCLDARQQRATGAFVVQTLRPLRT